MALPQLARGSVRSPFPEPSRPTSTAEPSAASRTTTFQRNNDTLPDPFLGASFTPFAGFEGTVETKRLPSDPNAAAQPVRAPDGVPQSFTTGDHSDTPQHLDLDAEDGVDHKWGDRSPPAGGQISAVRRLTIYCDDGKVEKQIFRFESIPEDSLKSKSAPIEDAYRSPEPSTFAPSTPANDGHRSSPLSSEQGRRRSSYAKSWSRSCGTRSPRVPPTSDREILAYATMAGDAMYDSLVRHNEENVIRLLQKPLTHNTDPASTIVGWVYAIRDPKLDLVKIGYSVKSPGDHRLKAIRKQCKLSSDAYLIRDMDIEKRPIRAFKRLEQLVHEDLRPQRWYYECACGQKNRGNPHNTEHHEWYDISDRIAMETIRVWRDFLLREPYVTSEGNNAHRLEEKLLSHIMARLPVSVFVRHEDNDPRLERWRSVLQYVAPKPAEVPVFRTALPQPRIEGKVDERINLMLENVARVANEPSFSDVPPSGGFDFTCPPKDKCFSSAPPARSSASQASVRQLNNKKVKSKQPTFVPLDAKPQSTSEHEMPPELALPPDGHGRPSGISRLKNFVVTHSLLADLLRSLDNLLRKERGGLSPRSAYNDIFTFRWLLSIAVILALYSSYIPPFLSMSLWAVFLPLFVGELREWK